MKNGPFYIALTYFFLGMLWIIYSDWLVYHLYSSDGMQSLTVSQNIKGGFYILATTVLLYLLIYFSQKKLTASQNKYRDLFHFNPTPMMIYDRKSLQVREVNQAAISLFGYPREELLQLTIDQLQPEDEKNAPAFDQAPIVQQIPTNKGLCRQKTKDGRFLYTMASHQKVKKGGILMIVQDVSKQQEYENQLVEMTRNLEDIISQRTTELKDANEELSWYNQKLAMSNSQLTQANQKIKEQNEVIRKQNQEDLDRILNSLKDVAWSIDLKEKKYVYLSRAAEEVSGIPYAEFRDNVNEWHKLIHPEDRSIIDERKRKVFSDGYSETTYRIRRPDGKILWIHDKVKLIKSESGMPLFMEGVASDITSLKSAEDEIIRYANRLNMILESITDGFFTINRDFCFTRVNFVFENLTGSERHRLLGKVIWEVFPPQVHPELHEQIFLAMKNSSTGNYQGYFHSFQLWLDIKFYPYLEGLSVFMRDITEEKKAQQDLSFNKKNLDALINNTMDLIWSITKDGYILSANKAFLDKYEKHFGTRLKVGDKLSTEYFDGYEVNDWQKHYDRAFQGKSFTIIKDDNIEGSEYYEISFNPIYDDHNEVIGIGCFARDITERRQHEQERNHLIEKLIAQNHGLEEFGYVTSHKIRAPVANILGIVNLLHKDEIKDEHNRSLIEYLNIAATTLDQTLKDLTMIMDMQTVKQEELEEVDLHEICNQAEEMLGSLIKETGAVLHCDFSKVHRIKTIRRSMLNILVQLLSNSMLYKKPDRLPEIRVKSFHLDGYMGISVADNGLGIDLSKYKNQLFKIYKRIHWNIQGKGIGLYLVKSQVEALNGKLEVESEINKGTTIKVLFRTEELPESLN